MARWGKVSRYRKRLFSNFIFLFIAFALTFAGFQYKREKSYRVGQLENTLQTYANIVNDYLQANPTDSAVPYHELSNLTSLFPKKELRITVIRNDGKVLFDSFVKQYELMENHLHRPEVQESLHKAYGKSIRHSATTQLDYYYCAINYGAYFVRAALPYDIQVENYLKVDSYFIYVLLLFFVVFGVMLIYLTDRFGKSVSTLQHFASQAVSGKNIDIKTEFPNNELGLVGKQIVEVYNSLQKTRKALSDEREKLFRHLQISHEGIAVFNRDKQLVLENSHFMQYLNIISDEPVVASDKVFEISELKPINDFINENIKKNRNQLNELTSNIMTLHKNGKYYIIQAMVFKDRGFEISINDVSKIEKEKKVKQQMTSNIAHELKTPVSSILGYIETILESDMDKEKMRFFLERSLFQTQRLSALIQDISLLNKIEESSDLFGKEPVNIKDTVMLVMDDLHMKIDEKNISVAVEIPNKLEATVSKSIFYSIWRNLTENSLNYAGENIAIRIKMYHEDENYLYFSYADNGVGIPEQHLARIFERFYRVDSGRARANGGTGLGLAIVKNGVLFHKGEISVKLPPKGGIEFVFTIAKES